MAIYEVRLLERNRGYAKIEARSPEEARAAVENDDWYHGDFEVQDTAYEVLDVVLLQADEETSDAD